MRQFVRKCNNTTYVYKFITIIKGPKIVDAAVADKTITKSRSWEIDFFRSISAIALYAVSRLYTNIGNYNTNRYLYCCRVRKIVYQSRVVSRIRGKYPYRQTVLSAMHNVSARCRKVFLNV